MEEEDKQSQEGPDEKDKSFNETETGRPRREAEGKGIGCLNPTMGVNCMRPRLAHFFSNQRTERRYMN